MTALSYSINIECKQDTDWLLLYTSPFDEDTMMRILIGILSVFVTGWVMVSPVALYGQAGQAVFDDFFMAHLPGGFFYISYLENYAPDTVLMIEESNGFALIDSPKVYFEGDLRYCCRRNSNIWVNLSNKSSQFTTFCKTPDRKNVLLVSRTND